MRKPLDSVDDKYLKTKCRPVVSKWDPSRGCLIALGGLILVFISPVNADIFLIARFTIDFMVFERVGMDKQLTCVTAGSVRAFASEIVESVENTTRKFAKNRPEAQERGILAVDIGCVFFLKGPPRRAQLIRNPDQASARGYL